MAYADLCGSKLRRTLGSSLNESASEGVLSESFAARQMKKMGWVEGTGLGKKRDGIVDHIRARKRDEGAGLGTDAVESVARAKKNENNMWWSESVGDILLKLQIGSKGKKGQTRKKKNEKKKRKELGLAKDDEEIPEEVKERKKLKKEKKKIKKETKRKRSDSPSKSISSFKKIYTDEELFEATGGARFGMRAQRRAYGKWHRTEKSDISKELEEKILGDNGCVGEWNGLGKARIIGAVSSTSGHLTNRTTNDHKDGGYVLTGNAAKENSEEKHEKKESSISIAEIKDGSKEKKKKKKKKKERKSRDREKKKAELSPS